MSTIAQPELGERRKPALSRDNESLWQGIERVYARLNQFRDGFGDRPIPGMGQTDARASAGLELEVPQTEAWRPIERLRQIFGLSEFESDVLLLCAGAVLDERFAAVLGGLKGHASPSFGLAMASLEGPHWSVISRTRPLRYWRLIEIEPGPMTQAVLTLDERILQFLLAVPALDERLDALHPLRSQAADADGAEESAKASQAVRRGARHWTGGLTEESRAGGPIVLTGGRDEERGDLFAAICRAANLRGWEMDAADLPREATERERLARAFTREAALGRLALLVRTAGLESPRDLEAWLARVDAPVAVEAAAGSPAERVGGLRIEVAPMNAGRRKELWLRELGPLADELNGDAGADGIGLDAIVEAFPLDATDIRQTAWELRQVEHGVESSPSQFRSEAWRLCRRAAQRSLDKLAMRVEVHAGWNDLVLPEAQVLILRQILANARQSARVYQDWGFAGRYDRGLGLSALFSGASGTGKTMAAGILAQELERDLYQIDLATVVSKYIGETEKHLRRIFDAAERSGAILLFDEADALFGKRSQVRDSHDRYANLEVSYLLQRMESYRGIALLTTNMQNALDPAFQRRLRFVVQFPFPDAASRERIWRSVFPAAAPIAGLDSERLAQLNITGGVIRNVALMAAFAAADEGSGIAMHHVLAAARTEYAKLDKPLCPAEIRGWDLPAVSESGGWA
jgi:ATPase family associated with various cellular activities (AAA)